MWSIVFDIACYVWFIFFIILVIYLYKKNYKPYAHEFNEEFYTKIPKKITPAELSSLMYNRIVSPAFSAVIIKLLNDKVLKIEEIDGIKYIKKTDFEKRSLSKLEEYTVNILMEVIGDGYKAKLDKNNLYTKKKKNCDILLNEYKIWCRIMRSESLKNNFFEPKYEYNVVKNFVLIGVVLFVINIICKFYTLAGFIILVPALFIFLFFVRIYKRTKEANEEYYKWLAFRRYLENIDKFDVKEKDIDDYIIYGTILNVKGLEQKLTNNNTFEEVTSIMNANILNAILRGNRYL